MANGKKTNAPGKRKAVELKAPADPWSLFSNDSAREVVQYFNNKTISKADPEDLEQAFADVTPALVRSCSLSFLFLGLADAPCPHRSAIVASSLLEAPRRSSNSC